jgi:uncharacterized coiled-coil protein SlyX
MDLNKIFTKTNFIIAGVVITGLLIMSNVNTRAKLSEARSKQASTEVLLSIVSNEKARLDSLVKVHVGTIKQLDSVIVKQDKKIAKDQKDIAALKDSLKIVQDNVLHVSADSSFSYINLRIPPIAELKYAFDSTQVKTIHYNFLERDGLFILNNKQGLMIQDLTLSSYTKDNQIYELKQLNNVYLGKEAILRKEKEAQSVEITGLHKTINNQKFQKWVTEGTLLGVVGVVVVKALLK